MKLQRIEHFIEVVTAGSIRGAARRLGMSQPALTRSLQQLEKDLGVQLMDRGVRGASLTQAGQTFLARARVAQAELAKAAEEARLVVGDLSSLVTLGVSPVAASLLLPEPGGRGRRAGHQPAQPPSQGKSAHPGSSAQHPVGHGA